MFVLPGTEMVSRVEFLLIFILLSIVGFKPVYIVHDLKCPFRPSGFGWTKSNSHSVVFGDSYQPSEKEIWTRVV